MPIIRKRRAPAAESPEESSAEETPNRRRHAPAEEDDYDDSNVLEGGGDETQIDRDGHAEMVKKLVRMALACDYARQPLRRADIGVKVLGSHGRRFKTVFADSQRHLRKVFGMEMVELPMKEKLTVSQRRAAKKTESVATSSKAWVLKSTLPEKFRTEEILRPSKAPSSEAEASYVGLYTFIFSVIALSGGSINEGKLERHLKRVNADQFTPVDKTDLLLKRLCKEGYLVRTKESNQGEETIEYHVGPRGKVEIGQAGVTGMVKSVYGEDAAEDLDERIARSMHLEEEDKKKLRTQAAETQRREGGRGGRRNSGRDAGARGGGGDGGSSSDDDSSDMDESE